MIIILFEVLTTNLFTRRNIDKSMEELGTCNFDPVKDPLCPIFKLDTIEKLAKVDFDKMAYEVSAVTVDLDRGFSLTCDIFAKSSLKDSKTPLFSSYREGPEKGGGGV